jgi:RNA polymerase sigma factor (sigma-70 family)
MADAAPRSLQTTLLYHFCRLRLPGVAIAPTLFARHLERGFELLRNRQGADSGVASWNRYLDNLHVLDWFLACGCLDGVKGAWESLFAARASRTDCLLLDALRGRAVRLFPRDSQRQEDAVAEFWGFLLAGEREGATPILARYDGQRPLVPWLIRVFQNKHLSDLRHPKNVQLLPDEELDARDLPLPSDGDECWHEEFRHAARSWLERLDDRDLLLLGLRLRYRLSQRDAANVLGIHEGNVSRQIAKLRDQCLNEIGEQLRQAGWTGDDLASFVYKEMDSLLLDEPRLSADRLAGLLASRGKALPPGAG